MDIPCLQYLTLPHSTVSYTHSHKIGHPLQIYKYFRLNNLSVNFPDKTMHTSTNWIIILLRAFLLTVCNLIHFLAKLIIHRFNSITLHPTLGTVPILLKVTQSYSNSALKNFIDKPFQLTPSSPHASSVTLFRHFTWQFK